jgi:hypothetical protein
MRETGKGERCAGRAYICLTEIKDRVRAAIATPTFKPMFANFLANMIVLVAAAVTYKTLSFSFLTERGAPNIGAQSALQFRSGLAHTTHSCKEV